MEQTLNIYKASAGSGKTFTLAVEYIMQLMQPHAENEFKHTLAVTFTNKATAEMKSRILETLYGLKMGLEEARPYMDAILERTDPPQPSLKGRESSPFKGELEGVFRLQAGKALTAILHDYSHFRVETIDAFFQSILRNMARELGLSANLQVELSHDEVIASAVDSLIETMDTRPEVRQWVLDYIHEQLDSGDKWDIVGPLKAFAGNIFREEYQRRSEAELKRISNAEVIKAFKSKMQAIRKKAEKEVQDAVDELMSQIEDFGQITYGKNLFNFLTDAKAMKSEGPGKSIYNSKFKIQNSSTFDLQARLAEFIALYEVRRKEYLSASLALRHLGMLRLLEYIDERAREIEGEAGRFTLSSTPALLSKMVEGSDAPFIFEKIGTFINYVMIDEFQDTSRMQWENFKKLLFEKLSSGGKGLLVGDIKQSIYRWRGGDWKILYGIEREKKLQRFHIHSEPLKINYRSHQIIVDFTKDFFPRAAALLDMIKPEAEIKLSRIYEDVGQEAKKKDGKGYVRVKLYKVKSEERRVKNNSKLLEDGTNSDSSLFTLHSSLLDMASQIRLLQEGGLDLSKIAILVRTNLMAQQIIEGFNQCAPDIRLVSEEAFLLEASTSVQMIVAALRLLIDKSHKDGISEKYLMLHYLRDVLGQNTTLQDIALRNAEEVLPEEFTAHREELLQLPLYLLAEKLWYIFSLGEIKGEDVYVLTFFDELQNHLRSAGVPDIQTFLTAWDEKLHQRSVPGSAVAGVRILTIHKSKGLEFHTVLLPFCHWDIEKDRQGEMLWCETDKVPYNELGALPISIYSKDVRSSVFAPNYEEEHLERRVDALNTLYVAFTRAKANLYIWGKTKPYDKEKDKNVTTAAELIYRSLRSDDNDTDEECFSFEKGTPLTTSNSPLKGENSRNEVSPSRADLEGSVNRLRIEHREKDAIDVRVITRNPMLYFLQSNQAEEYLNEIQRSPFPAPPLGESPIVDTSPLKSTPPKGERGGGYLSQREIGKRMHEVLSRINDVGQLEEVLRKAREEGVIGEGDDWQAITERIKQGFQSPLVASWFSAGNTVYNECGIASIDDDGLPCVLRPDRVVIHGNDITVIDYKFGHPSKLYKEQVGNYMDCLRKMYPEHNVKGYIWYIMGKGAVEVKSEKVKG